MLRDCFLVDLLEGYLFIGFKVNSLIYFRVGPFVNSILKYPQQSSLQYGNS